MKRQLRSFKQSLGGVKASALVPLIAFIYVGLIIILPALEVVVGALAKGIQPFLDNFQSE